MSEIQEAELEEAFGTDVLVLPELAGAEDDLTFDDESQAHFSFEELPSDFEVPCFSEDFSVFEEAALSFLDLSEG